MKSKNLISISDFKKSITEFEPNSHNSKSKIPNKYVYLELFLIYYLDIVTPLTSRMTLENAAKTRKG